MKKYQIIYADPKAERGKRLKDMTLEELKEEARPITEREEKEHKERIDRVLRSIGIRR